jgi:hypothetical protein
MDALLTAIMTKVSGSALSTDVSGRIYLDQYPSSESPATFPYCVFFIVSGVPHRTFTERYTNTLIQFSLFSSSQSAVEITNMYNDLKTLLDECSLTITGNTLVWMREQNLTTMTEDITTADGTQSVKHWACDYEVLTSLN